MSQRLRIILRGRDAELGRVSSSDFAQLLLLTQSALARTAGHVIAQPVRATGRWSSVVDEATRLRLVALEPGSIQAVLELPDVSESEGVLELADPRLGEVAFDRMVAFIRDSDHRSMPDVASMLVQLGDRLGLGARFDEIEFGDDGPAGRPRQGAQLDVVARERLRRAASAPPQPGAAQVVGVLYEADFEAMRARLRLPGRRDHVTVDFDDHLADDIQAALRHQASLVGEVAIDAQGGRAVSVRLREITVAEQLVAGTEDFWRDADVAQLAEEQGVAPAARWSDFRDHAATAEEVDGVLGFLAR